MPTPAAVRTVPHAHAAVADNRVDGLDEASHKDLGLLGREHAPLEVPALRAQPSKVKAAPVPWDAVGEPMLRLVQKARVVVEREGRLTYVARQSSPLLRDQNKPPIHRREEALDVPVDGNKKVREKVRVIKHQSAADGGAASRNAGRPAKVARQPPHDSRIRGLVQPGL